MTVERIRRVTVILNPVAGRGQGAKRQPALERLLEESVRRAAVRQGVSEREFTWRICRTAAPEEAVSLARRAAEEGAQVVAAAGGDGTCGDVVNGLAGTTAHLGILPLGTGNDFARTLGFGTDLARAVDALFSGSPRPLDLGLANGRRFLNIAGCGFDAVVAERINRGIRFLRGTPAYLAAVLQTLAAYHPVPLRLTLDGVTHEAPAMLCCVANAQSYGGGMRIAPDARFDDGLFDICLLKAAGRIEFLRAFPRVFQGTHVTHPKVQMFRARRVCIESDPPLPVLVDGEVIGRTPLDAQILPYALTVQGETAPRADASEEGFRHGTSG